MVFFTCQKCNEGLKKNAVFKHGTFKRNCLPFWLTCIDCLKDFRGEEYQKHTSCVSEEVRYGEKGLQVKREGLKQDMWMESVNNVLNRPHNRNVAFIFNALRNQSNVPKTKKKFHNFLLSKLGWKRHNAELSDEVFTMLQTEFNNSKSKTDNSEKTNGKDENVVDEKAGENTNQELNEEKMKKKSKKHKTEDVETPVENGANQDEDNSKKKKKKSEDGSQNQEENALEDESEKPVKSKKSKKHKKDKDVDNSIENEVSEDVASQENNEDKKSKKRKSLIENGSCENHDVEHDVSENQVKTKKSKKHKNSEVLEEINGQTEEPSQQDENGLLDVSENQVKSKKPNSSQEAEETNGETTKNQQDENCNPEESQLSKKELKKKKKQEKYLAELMEIENYQKEDIEEPEKPTGKKKRKHEDAEEVTVTKGKKRKLDAQSTDELPIENKNKVEAAEPDSTTSSPTEEPGNFKWGQVILEVLQNRSDNELSLKRLSKKVIGEYCEKFGVPLDFERLMKKFNKKLHTTKGVVVFKDKARFEPQET